MTRKDYQLLAGVLAETRPAPTCRQRGLWDRICAQLAIALAEDNPRFDSGRFFEAATKDQGGV